MANQVSVEGIEYIVFRIAERAKEAAEESREDGTDSFKGGRALAYYEVLDILRSELEARDINLKDVGLDFDLEKELL